MSDMVDQKGTKSQQYRLQEIKNCVIVMLAALSNKQKLPLYIILKWKSMPKEKLQFGAIYHCHEKGWITNDFMVDQKRVWS